MGFQSMLSKFIGPETLRLQILGAGAAIVSAPLIRGYLSPKPYTPKAPRGYLNPKPWRV